MITTVEEGTVAKPGHDSPRSGIRDVCDAELAIRSPRSGLSISEEHPRFSISENFYSPELEIREIFGCENDCGFQSSSYTAVLEHEAICPLARRDPPAADRKFRCKVNQENKAVELPLFRIGGSGSENPHMRAFWGSTISLFMGFFGWFALAPVTLDVMHSVGVCENQLYIVGKDLTRKAFVDYVNKDGTQAYCVHGRLDDSSDCKEIPDVSEIPACQEDPLSSACVFARSNKYDFSALMAVRCLCNDGTACKDTVSRGLCASAASAILARIAMGKALEVWGPVRVQSLLLLFTGVMVAMSAAIETPARFVIFRFLIGCSGATFITNQFWCSLMFAPNVVGTANATAAGWGNLGGGMAQICIIWGLMIPFRRIFDVDEDLAWRYAMLVPAMFLVVLACCGYASCWDAPTKRRFDKSDSTGSAYFSAYSVCLRDPKVLLMMGQYAACFGTEVVMNNMLATYFRVHFEMSAGTAALWAGSFGAMNLFARSLGGMLSDEAFARFGFRGRLWSQFIALVFEGLTFYGFSLVTKSHQWYHLLFTLVPFSIFVNISEGTSYGIVPFINKEHLAVITAIVGAAGSAGAVFVGFAFYMHDWEDPRAPFKKHAQFVLFSAFLTPLYHWPEYGSMFSPPSISKSNAMREAKSVQSIKTTMGSRALLAPQLAQALHLDGASGGAKPPPASDFDFLDMVQNERRAEHPAEAVAAPERVRISDADQLTTVGAWR
jgi:NNP family nitrate/nitrite transporter-like MFS transporter